MLDNRGVKDLFGIWAELMAEYRQELIELDSLCGDSDLGLTMAKGFEAASNEVKRSSETDLGRLVYSAGKAMGQAVPSTMGTLMASGLMNAGKELKGKEVLNKKDQTLFFKAYYDGVQKRGGAKEGEKTFLDGLGPAIRALENNQENMPWNEAVSQAVAAAEQGYQGTCTMLAKHGRMAIRGEGSRQYYDPGARVAWLLMQGYVMCLSKGE